MRDLFHGYIPLKEDEHASLLQNATIVLDTNALLNLYRYTPKARRELLTGLKSISRRLWIPHQVADEFHRRRVGVIREQQAFCENLDKNIKQVSRSASSHLDNLGTNPFVEIKAISKRISEFFEILHKEEVERCRTRASQYAITPQSDPILNEIVTLYDQRVGSPYSESDWELIRKEGDERFKNQIPPGFNDQNKDGDKKYGDFVIWKQVIDYAKNESQDIIFVTDDGKDDWWWTSKGERLGPHPSLRAEFYTKAGHRFYAYRVQNFVQALNEVQNTSVSQETVEEVREISATLERGRMLDRQAAVRRRRLNQIRQSYGSALKHFEEQRVAVERLRGRLNETWPGSFSEFRDLLTRAELDHAETTARIATLSAERDNLRKILASTDSSSAADNNESSRAFVELEHFDHVISRSMHDLESSQRLINEVSAIRDDFVELHKAEERLQRAESRLVEVTSELTATEME
ncbi:PIN domain-containing protein [Amycolatopsis sp. 195334CR]|uniref:PIN domain-containing protein n=1 Tax=Amycolatopsis sp. 195334CR TaxID=2814588 RepID=UPI001A8D2F12|nr:PIN domain-containing protein [Amycolatopsis sp. 195334CR]MBN6036635.1 DUF4935 domain-containing protein [Amycolatopsis sp. 195334CR]